MRRRRRPRSPIHPIPIESTSTTASDSRIDRVRSSTRSAIARMEPPLVAPAAPAAGFAQQEEGEEKRYRVIRDSSGQERILVPVPHFEWVDIDAQGQLYVCKEWETSILGNGERRTLPQVVRDDPDLADEVAGFERAQDIVEKERAKLREELLLYGAIRLPADYLKIAAGGGDEDEEEEKPR